MGALALCSCRAAGMTGRNRPSLHAAVRALRLRQRSKPEECSFVLMTAVGDSYGQFSRRNSAAATADRDATRQRQRRPSTARTARSGATVENKTSTHRAIKLKPSYRGLFSFSWRRFGSTSGSSWERCDCYRFCSSGIRRSARKAAPCGLARSRVVPRHVGCALVTVLHWTGHASSPRTPMPSRSKVLRRRCQHQR